MLTRFSSKALAIYFHPLFVAEVLLQYRCKSTPHSYTHEGVSVLVIDAWPNVSWALTTDLKRIPRVGGLTRLRNPPSATSPGGDMARSASGRAPRSPSLLEAPHAVPYPPPQGGDFFRPWREPLRPPGHTTMRQHPASLVRVRHNTCSIWDSPFEDVLGEGIVQAQLRKIMEFRK